MALKKIWDKLTRGRSANPDSAAAEQRLDEQRQAYENSHQQRGRMSGNQGAGNVGF